MNAGDWLATFRDILLKPVAFFNTQKKVESATSAVVYVGVLYLAYTVAVALYANLTTTFESQAFLWLGVALWVGVKLLWVFVEAAGVYVWTLICGGKEIKGRLTYQKALLVTSFAITPIVFLDFHIVGQIIGSIWTAALLYIAAMTIFGIERKRAALMWLLIPATGIAILVIAMTYGLLTGTGWNEMIQMMNQ